MKFNYKTVLFCGVLAGSSLAFSAEPWDEKYYNPKAAEGDVILPMPCGGSMVFRKVPIPLNGPLDDYPLVMGQEGVGMSFAEHTRPEFIAGGFTEPKPQNARYFLLAKYEMTELQYKVLFDENCPQPSNKLRMPALPTSWFGAVGVIDKYNQWLRANAIDQLPKEDGKLGVVRLPTEVEWEYAARGGIAVSSAEFRDVTYPMPEGLNGYEWFSGSQSANGKLQLTGLLKPNPLGLHDMLGNADEAMLEPFRLNKLDRGHGQAGGYLVRGGNYLSAPADVRSSMRREESYYPDAGANKTTGLRLAVGASAFTSRERVQLIESEWKVLGKDNSGKAKSESAVGELGKLASNVGDEALKVELKRLEGEIRANNQAQAEARDQAIRASLNLGAFLCTKMLDDGKFVDFLQKNYDLNCAESTADPSCPAREQKLAEQKERVQKLGRYYASTIVETSTLYSEDLIAVQIPILSEIIANNVQLRELEPYLNTHWKNQRLYLTNGAIDVFGWLESCKNVVK